MSRPKITVRGTNSIRDTNVHNPVSLFMKPRPSKPGPIARTSISCHNDIPIITPMDVATPLPPLNLKKIDQLWPTINSSAAIELNQFSTLNNTKKKAGIRPLNRKSNNPTAMAYFLPTILSTLDAPTFPEPLFVMSCPLEKSTHIYAVGKEPSKYAPKLSDAIQMKLIIFQRS